MMKALILHTLVLLLINASTLSLKVYRSIEVIDDNFIKTRQHGLHYLKENQTATFTNSVTFCLRFKYQQFAKGAEARIWEIKEPGSWVHFMFISAQYPATWFFFGNNHRPNADSNWVLKDPITNDFNIWRMNTWHSVCMAYNKEKSHIAMIKVSCLHSHYYFDTLKLMSYCLI